ncbi:MAG: dethiobiotin synthetase [Chitinophagaceae bacterium]|nr:dethiobiotin synthetase [Chitinophagaceae bacterium]
MGKPLFITGIGTEIGKTVVAAIVTEALEADYWKPVQCGNLKSTDSHKVKALVSNKKTICHPENYLLKMPASPHLASKQENISVSLNEIKKTFDKISGNSTLVIEGAGGILVPLNDKHFNADLIKKLDATVIIVSRNYLGSINHSLLTAEFCRQNKLDVAGWIFNDQFMNYEDEIVNWSGYPKLGSIPVADHLSKKFVKQMAELITPRLKRFV